MPLWFFVVYISDRLVVYGHRLSFSFDMAHRPEVCHSGDAAKPERTCLNEMRETF